MKGCPAVWIDIENPPQVQYLLPFMHAFERMGCGVMVTARRDPVVIDLIRARGITPLVAGKPSGRHKLRKVAGVMARAWALQRIPAVRNASFLVCSSRAAAVVAWHRRIPSYVLCDYEHVELSLYRRTGCHIAFPMVIGVAHFRRLGFEERRLIPFSGLKEGISFSGIELPIGREEIGLRRASPLRVLVRPAAEDSHYYQEGSGDLTRALLRHLSAREDITVVFAPRHREQAAQLKAHDWARDPVLIDRPIPFPGLLATVDAVISGGGTMHREAAFAGIPAFSTFRGALGGVDRHLAELGRLHFLRSPADFGLLQQPHLCPRPPLEKWPALVDDLAATLLEHFRRSSSERG